MCWMRSVINPHQSQSESFCDFITRFSTSKSSLCINIIPSTCLSNSWSFCRSEQVDWLHSLGLICSGSLFLSSFIWFSSHPVKPANPLSLITRTASQMTAMSKFTKMKHVTTTKAINNTHDQEYSLYACWNTFVQPSCNKAERGARSVRWLCANQTKINSIGILLPVSSSGTV